MNPGALKSWLDAYGRAWENRDPEAAASLFTEDATYHESPLDELMRGRSKIVEYWSFRGHRQTSISTPK
jgi:nuclear transport factor 2 (NTF2) superfamily protein